jgi:hypothetical protein
MLLKQKYGSSIVKEEQDTLFVDNVGLRFKDDRLSEVVFLSDPSLRMRP